MLSKVPFCTMVLTARWSIATAVAIVSLFLGAPLAEAQTVLRPSDRIEAASQAVQSVPVGGVIGGTGLGDCYLLPTERGSRWRIGVEPSGVAATRFGVFAIELRVGETCETGQRVRGTPDAYTFFNAGGGAYWVVIKRVARDANYLLAVAQIPGVFTDGLMPAGTSIGVPSATASTAPPGTASTYAAEAPSSPEAGQIIQDCDHCPSMIVVPAGSFMMGTPSTEADRNAAEGPRHPVTLPRSFAVGRYEVTFDEYDACVADHGCRQVSDATWGRGRRPVINVSYDDGLRYVAWLSRTTGHAYFLPSESEWEYVARAGTDTPWNTGIAIITDDANILDVFQKTVVVGSYPPNAFGIYDVHGNVNEWTQDCYDTGYLGAPADGSAAIVNSCAQPIARGGGFRAAPSSTRVGARIYGPNLVRTTSADNVGFRVTRALD